MTWTDLVGLAVDAVRWLAGTPWWLMAAVALVAAVAAAWSVPRERNCCGGDGES